MSSSLARPFRPIELGAETSAFFELPRLARDLQGGPEYERTGVSALTLARDEQATLVLVALRQGATMREHRAPSAALVVLLSGRARFTAGSGVAGRTVEPGCLAAFSADVPHAVEALEDSAYVVIIGGRERHVGSRAAPDASGPERT